MGVILTRRTLPFMVAGAATGGLVIRSAKAQPSCPAATPIPVAVLAEPTTDGIDVPVLGIAFGGGEIVATPRATAGPVRMLTAVPCEDFGSVIFRIPDDQPDAIEQIWAGFAQPEPVLPDWIWETYFPGGVRPITGMAQPPRGLFTVHMPLTVPTRGMPKALRTSS